MGYKSRAERRYRRKRAKAAGVSPRRRPGAWGKGSVSRSDLVLLRRAIRENWDIPEATRLQILQSLCGIMGGDGELMVGSVLLTVIRMEEQNQNRELQQHPRLWPTDRPVRPAQQAD